MIIKWILFAVFSAGIAYISRGSLNQPRSHGFYRFIAWEAMLGLFLLNVETWFRDPFSGFQIVSWILLFGSIPPVIIGAAALHRMGKADDQRSDTSLYGFEKTTTLVESGIYHYIRHPLYCSLLLLTWGIFFKDPSWIGLLPAGLASVSLVLTAKMEEAENTRYFGPVYQEYMKRTKMFLPFLF